MSGNILIPKPQQVVVNTRAASSRYTPQWGRSVTGMSSGQRQRLVSLRFDSPQDLSVYMRANLGFLNPRDFPFPMLFEVSYGTGGTSITQQLRSAAVGSCYHFTAQHIDVDAVADPNLVSVTAPNRIQAWCSVGTPQSQWLRYSASASAVESAKIAIPPFARGVQLQGGQAARFATTVFNLYDYTNTQLWSRPASDFAASRVPINNRAVEYTQQNPGGNGTLDPFEVTWEIYQ